MMRGRSSVLSDFVPLTETSQNAVFLTQITLEGKIFVLGLQFQRTVRSELATAYLAVRKAEWEAMKHWKLEEEVQLLLERY